MADYIDKLLGSEIKQLVDYMSCKPKEKSNRSISCYGGKLYIIHGKDNNGEILESIFTDYHILKLYNCEPSVYDQMRFHGIMEQFRGNDYMKNCKNFYNKNNLKWPEDIKLGDLDDEDDEEYEDE